MGVVAEGHAALAIALPPPPGMQPTAHLAPPMRALLLRGCLLAMGIGAHFRMAEGSRRPPQPAGSGVNIPGRRGGRGGRRRGLSNPSRLL